MNTTASTVPMQPASTDDKTAAIVTYLTLIGFIVAVIMHGSKKTRLGAFHLRQALGLFLGSFAASMCMVIPLIGWIAGFVAIIGLFVLWVMGLISAINGQLKPVPVLGEHFQKWFGTAFD